MSVDLETLRRELLHVAGAGMHIENPVAVMAPKMVVVLMTRKFVARRLAWQLHELDLAGIGQLFEISVDRGQAEGRHVALGLDQDFRGKQRTCGCLHDRAYRMALAGGAFHGSIVAVRTLAHHSVMLMNIHYH